MVERCIVEMGRCASGKPHVLAYPNETSRLIVGSFSSLAGTAIFLLGGDHHAEWVSTCPFAELLELPGAWQPTSRGDIVLGSDVWVGTRATVLSGVSIGHGAVVGAGAVVTRDVRPYAVVGGVPAREVRRRFSDEIVDALLRIAWWEWPMEQVRREVGLLRSPDVKEFVERFDPGRH